MIDARLAAPALAAWSVVALVLLVAQRSPDSGARLQQAIVIAAGIAVAALIVVVLVRSAVVIGIVMAALAACIVVVLHAVAIWGGPVAELAAAGRTVTVQAVVQGEPRPIAGPVWQVATQGLVPLATSAIEVDGERITVEVPLTLLCACEAGDLVVGSHVIVRGRLSPGRDIASAATLRLQGQARVVRAPGPVEAIASDMRTGLRAALAGSDPASASLVAGLSTGDESLMPTLLAEQMRATGLSHLTAVSGANVAIVIACALGLGALVGLGMRGRAVLALLAILGFVVLVRPEPSVVRAAAMGVVVVLALLSGGRRAGPAALAVAVLLLTLLAPALAVSWAFALSVAATLGIVVGAARLGAVLPWRLPPALAAALAVTIAAQLATLPVLLLMDASMSWVSIPANLLAEVAVAPVTVLGLLAALVSPAAPPLAAVLAGIAALPARFIVAVAGWADGLPGAHRTWPGGVVGLVLLVGLVAAAIALAPAVRGQRRHPVVLVTASALVLLLVRPPSSGSWPPQDWVIVACDVGQGDALVVRGSHETAMVIDVGPDVRSMEACLRDLGVTRIGLLVLTHFHADHVGGIEAAYARPVDDVLVSPVEEPPDSFRRAQAVISAHARTSRVHVATPGARVSLPGIEATILWPARRLEAGSVPNNGSVVLHVVAQGVGILLAGDVEREAQAAIAAMPRPRIDVLKAPHHGSANLDDAFVRWARAPITLVSVGEGNDYGHPSPAALSAFDDGLLGRTDADGALAVVRSEAGLALVRRG